jgi:CubicO group peptidase (beta-lactamase class C family)
MRKLFTAFGAMAILGLGILALNWGSVQRLLMVKDFLNPERVVYNFAHAGDAFHRRDLVTSAPEHMWERAPRPLPETVNILGENVSVEAFLTDTDAVALLVIKDGIIRFEDYYQGAQAGDHRISWSVSKSFLSAMIGAAVDRGDIKTLDDNMDIYAPRLKGTAYEGVSIRNVLNMSSGVKFNEDYFDSNSDVSKMTYLLAVSGSLDAFTTRYKDHDFKAGEFMRYVSIDTHALGMVLRGATGKTASENFEDVLGRHLGFSEGIHYITDSEGSEYVLGGLNMTARDYALLGQLFLQKGVWNGEQVISKDWVHESTAPSAPPPLEGGRLGYGYQWWVPMPRPEPHFQNDFSAAGFYGQHIYVNPDHGTVIVKLSTFKDASEVDENGVSHGLLAMEFYRGLSEYYAKAE